MKELLKQHKQERDYLKAIIYDAEQRIKELNGVIAALEKVSENQVIENEE